MQPSAQNKRVIFLMSSLTYRAEPFLKAADKLGLEVVCGLDMPPPLAEYWRPTLPVDLKTPQKAAQDIFSHSAHEHIDAIVALDDSATMTAALASELLDLSHNAPDAANAARDKHQMRLRLSRAGVPAPHFQLFNVNDDPLEVAQRVKYPCVIKPLMLSGSQGVIRANDAEEFTQAFKRTSHIVRYSGGEDDANNDREHILVEDFISGFEVALEGIMTLGALKPLALFDKPDPLDGPFFEETIYVTPSRLPQATQDAILDCAAAACRALGLREGPVHAELRVNEQGPWVVEVAGRSIGGL